MERLWGRNQSLESQVGTGQNPGPPPPVEVEGQEEYEVQSIEDSKIDHGTLLYRVRWKGWADLTWDGTIWRTPLLLAHSTRSIQTNQGHTLPIPKPTQNKTGTQIIKGVVLSRPPQGLAFLFRCFNPLASLCLPHQHIWYPLPDPHPLLSSSCSFSQTSNLQSCCSTRSIGPSDEGRCLWECITQFTEYTYESTRPFRPSVYLRPSNQHTITPQHQQPSIPPHS
ncbi:hypothetical protein BJ508DRAFT_19925 [Ascobolus immersus RN42]|uniref:Chromo domain-containing protein n=1 Tax=Ascobolus immersus RN42 TaxID=1160509 RepID=A0A3N4IL85_ASCIM|nr:hypothetical protein BJ508DRAFT_19925 [Ascobolus immersus RN42]